MWTLTKDYYAIGIEPNGYDLLILLIDLELGFAEHSPGLYVLGYIIDGYSHREAAEKAGVCHKTIQNFLDDVRNNYFRRN
jgi:hypothetical protein